MAPIERNMKDKESSKKQAKQENSNSDVSTYEEYIDSEGESTILKLVFIHHSKQHESGDGNTGPYSQLYTALNLIYSFNRLRK